MKEQMNKTNQTFIKMSDDDDDDDYDDDERLADDDDDDDVYDDERLGDDETWVLRYQERYENVNYLHIAREKAHSLTWNVLVPRYQRLERRVSRRIHLFLHVSMWPRIMLKLEKRALREEVMRRTEALADFEFALRASQRRGERLPREAAEQARKEILKDYVQ
jgi:hypothetical protein